MKTLEDIEMQLKQEEIAARAMHRWEEAGHHHHRDLEHWLQAEAELGAAASSHRATEHGSEVELTNSSLECAEELLAPAW